MNSLKIYTDEEVTQKLNACIEEGCLRHSLLWKVIPVIETMAGKVINVKLKDRIRAALPLWTVYVERSKYSGIRLTLWRGEGLITYSNQFSLQIAPKDETYARIDLEFIRTANPLLFNIPDRTLKLKAWREKISDYVSRWNVTLYALKALASETGWLEYPLSSLFNVYIDTPREEVNTE